MLHWSCHVLSMLAMHHTNHTLLVPVCLLRWDVFSLRLMLLKRSSQSCCLQQCNPSTMLLQHVGEKDMEKRREREREPPSAQNSSYWNLGNFCSIDFFNNPGMVMLLMRLMRFCGRFPTSSPRWRGTGPAKVSFFSRSVMASVLSRNHPLKKAMATWPACELVWACEVASKIT